MLERGLCVAMGSLSIGGGLHDSLVMLKVALGNAGTVTSVYLLGVI